MWLLDSLLWKPREGIVYTYKRWHRRKQLVKTFPKSQGAGWGLEGWRKQNLSKVHIEIDGNRVPGTFRIYKEVCTLGTIGHGKKLSKRYSTPVKNVKFYKKDLRIKTKGIDVVNYTHRYDYICKVIDSTKLVKVTIPDQIVRRRGTAIIDTPDGILVVAGRKRFILPGGAHKGETREKATMRGVEEETGLRVISSKYLFTHHDPEDRKIRNLHKVFLVKVKGKAKPDRHEVKHITYWKEGSEITLSNTTKVLIEKYRQMRV